MDLMSSLFEMIFSCQMGKPDFVNEALGAAFGGVVGPIVDEVIEGLKFVSHCREQCTALREQLERIQPTLVKISTHYEPDPKMKWLDASNECIKRAQEIVKNCRSKDSSTLDTVMDRLKEMRYGREILELCDRIKDLVISEGFFLLQANPYKPRFGIGWTKQDVP